MPTSPRDIFALNEFQCSLAQPVFLGSIGNYPCKNQWLCRFERETAYEYIVRCAQLADIKMHPVIQRPDPIRKVNVYPALVYTEIGNNSESSFDGPLIHSYSFRFDVRGPDYVSVESARSRFVNCLVREGRVETDAGILDEYDESLKIYRKIQTIDILA